MLSFPSLPPTQRVVHVGHFCLHTCHILAQRIDFGIKVLVFDVPRIWTTAFRLLSTHVFLALNFSLDDLTTAFRLSSTDVSRHRFEASI